MSKFLKTVRNRLKELIRLPLDRLLQMSSLSEHYFANTRRLEARLAALESAHANLYLDDAFHAIRALKYERGDLGDVLQNGRRPRQLLFIVQSDEAMLQWGSLLEELARHPDEFSVRALLIPTVQPHQHDAFTYNWRAKLQLDARKIPYRIDGAPGLPDYDPGRPGDDLLRADEVFFQTPYDAQRAPHLYADRLRRWTRINYIPYGFTIVDLPIYQYESPFLDHCTRYFLETDRHLELAHRHKPAIAPAYRVTGYPKLDAVSAPESAGAPGEPDGVRTTLWNPRWILNDPSCTLRWSLPVLYAHYRAHPEERLIFRPHPLLYRELARSPEWLEKIWALEALPNVHVDNESDYRWAFREADVLLSDASSLLAEFLATGKPVVFAYNEPMPLNAIGREFLPAFTEVRNATALARELRARTYERPAYREQRKRVWSEIRGDGPSAASRIVAELRREV